MAKKSTFLVIGLIIGTLGGALGVGLSRYLSSRKAAGNAVGAATKEQAQHGSFKPLEYKSTCSVQMTPTEHSGPWLSLDALLKGNYGSEEAIVHVQGRCRVRDSVRDKVQ